MTLLRYTLKRLLQTIPVLIAISLIIFVLVNSLPGNPILAQLQGQEITQELINNLEARYGLDQPLHERYLSYVSGLLVGDLGYSIYYEQPVSSLMIERVGPTLLLVLSAYLLALTTSIPLGVVAAKFHNDLPDHASRILALIGVSTPGFWIGIMMIILFSVVLGWLPSGNLVYPWRPPSHYGYGSQLELYVQTARHLLLPMIALGTLQMAVLMRIERTSMLESLREEYVQTARAYGVPEQTILRRHAFRPAQLPVITIVGLNLSTALGGSVVIEEVFNINGMGRLLLSSIQVQDYQVVMSVTLVLAVIFLIGVVITDIAYAYIDPRVTYGER
ncbi:ABC transporter permease subunit [Halobellus sp. GM3]|uniref:ABC transporter permease subunit n=1 Tax=Halobellus sp. GM3 TaxID=3458410 RepID=UPI00403DCDD1